MRKSAGCFLYWCDVQPLYALLFRGRSHAVALYCYFSWLDTAYFHERRSLNNFHRDRVITFEQIAE
ncbi:hypothetical protein FQI64_23730 [Escherichia coli]|nr:hypothetical protein [Escherichia coli]